MFSPGSAIFFFRKILPDKWPDSNPMADLNQVHLIGDK